MGTTGKMLFSGGSNIDYSSVNPSPTNFRIKMCFYRNEYTVMKVNYPDCNNYEGDKILVFLGDKTKDLKSIKSLDPHFCEGSDLIARFAPTTEGLIAARNFTLNTQGEKNDFYDAGVKHAAKEIRKYLHVSQEKP